MNNKNARTTKTSLHADDILNDTLSALDAIVADAQRYLKEQEECGGARASSHRKDCKVFAAMAEPHYHTLQSIVMTYGLQLLPSLELIQRRVLLVLSFPAAMGSSWWELAALLGTYFRAGAARILEELLLVLLEEKRPFLLHSPCLTGWAVEDNFNEIEGQTTRGNDRATELAVGKEKTEISAVLRNMQAFDEMLLALGPFVQIVTIQRVAHRFAQEVVLEGVLDDSGRIGGGFSHDSLVSDAGAQNRRPLVISELLKPKCVDLLTTLLTICRPLPSTVAACAVRVMKEIPSRFCSLGKDSGAGSCAYDHRHCHYELLRAVQRLSAVFTALRHPCALPFYLPSRESVEQHLQHDTMEDVLANRRERSEKVGTSDVKVELGKKRESEKTVVEGEVIEIVAESENVLSSRVKSGTFGSVRGTTNDVFDTDRAEAGDRRLPDEREHDARSCGVPQIIDEQGTLLTPSLSSTLSTPNLPQDMMEEAMENNVSTNSVSPSRNRKRKHRQKKKQLPKKNKLEQEGATEMCRPVYIDVDEEDPHDGRAGVCGGNESGAVSDLLDTREGSSDSCTDDIIPDIDLED
ncbi:hypothetical protein TRVL_08485 [Trypanosoma vivax]|nr:hypothetical protein TRVL_08485 [Trypanosoma vivax]